MNLEVMSIADEWFEGDLAVDSGNTAVVDEQRGIGNRVRTVTWDDGAIP